MPQENLDASATASESEQSASEPSSETSGADLSTDSTQATTESTAEGTSTETDSTVTVDTQIEEDAQANAQKVETTTEPPAQPEIDYKKRFIGAQKSWQQERAEKQAMAQQLAELQQRHESFEKQFQGVDAKEIEQFRASQKSQLWDEAHPDHGKFIDLLKKQDFYAELIQNEDDPEIVKRLQVKFQQAIGPEGVKNLRDHRAYVAQQQWELRVNPAGYYRKLIQREAQPVIQDSLRNVSQTYQSVQQAQNEVQQWMKANAEIATPENIKSVLDLMQKGASFELASLRVERDYERKNRQDGIKAKQSAEEKERILQGNAAGTIARNPKSFKRVDPKAVAKERGVKNSREFADMLFELDAQGEL
jgi:hypothetical protein